MESTTKTPANDNPAPARRVICARCGAGFDCAPAGDCWCKSEPVRLPMPAIAANEDCLCPACLRAAAQT